jgi:hypothetical protein
MEKVVFTESDGSDTINGLPAPNPGSVLKKYSAATIDGSTLNFLPSVSEKMAAEFFVQTYSW